MEKYLEIGKIQKTHGVRGVVKIDPWCDRPAVLASQKIVYLKTKDGFTPLNIVHASPAGTLVLASFEGITSIEEAAKLKNTVIYADRDNVPLPKGSHFIVDLIGLDVINADTGKLYGKVANVITGANEIYEIDTPTGKAYLPAVAEFVVRVDLESGIYVRPIKGIFDEI
ncbi:MAG: 16S rRNA processing protein RimM [Clostridia bacterium]|nr:16S rRNA processing protein RimM [Clostridia bacterium]